MKEIKVLSTKDAKLVIAASEQLSKEYEELKGLYETGELNHSFEQGNFFSMIEDTKKVVIQYLTEEDEAVELVVGSLEQALVAIRDIEEA